MLSYKNSIRSESDHSKLLGNVLCIGLLIILYSYISYHNVLHDTNDKCKE